MMLQLNDAHKSYFLAEVNNITRKNFDKQLATIHPCTSIDPTLDIHENEMCLMKLHPDVCFIWEREMMDQGYVVVDHGETCWNKGCFAKSPLEI